MSPPRTWKSAPAAVHRAPRMWCRDAGSAFGSARAAFCIIPFGSLDRASCVWKVLPRHSVCCTVQNLMPVLTNAGEHWRRLRFHNTGISLSSATALEPSTKTVFVTHGHDTCNSTKVVLALLQQNCAPAVEAKARIARDGRITAHACVGTTWNRWYTWSLMLQTPMSCTTGGATTSETRIGGGNGAEDTFCCCVTCCCNLSACQYQHCTSRVTSGNAPANVCQLAWSQTLQCTGWHCSSSETAPSAGCESLFLLRRRFPLPAARGCTTLEVSTLQRAAGKGRQRHVRARAGGGVLASDIYFALSWPSCSLCCCLLRP